MGGLAPSVSLAYDGDIEDVTNLSENDTQNKYEESPILTEDEINKLNQWVFYDEESNEFNIVEGAEDILSLYEYTLLTEQLDVTNFNLSQISGSESSIVFPEEVEDTHTVRGYKKGVNDIKFYWWGARVYLSKSTVNSIGAGLSIGGIWIPQKIVASVVATLGVVLGACPGGGVFDYRYLGLIVGPTVTNIRFQ